MDLLFYIFAAAVGIAAALTSIAIWAPRRTPIRVAAVLIAALFIPLAYAEMMALLSKPKPMSYEWFEGGVEKAAVLGVSLHEGTAIYMWLRLDGAMEPRYYVLPWQQQLAERLEGAVKEAISEHATVMITKPFTRENFKKGGFLNIEVVRPPLPPMKKPLVPPQIFNPRDVKI